MVRDWLEGEIVPLEGRPGRYRCNTGVMTTEILQIQVAMQSISFWAEEGGELATCLNGLPAQDIRTIYSNPASFSNNCGIDIKIHGPPATSGKF